MNDFSLADHKFMQRAISLAKRGHFTTSPNPRVGCVIVRNEEVVGEGFHQKAGQGHAEVHALKQAGIKAKGATAYVTLEPCSHYGLTPPCAEALIKAQVAHVIAAMVDPNPKVSGRGLELLNAAPHFECSRVNILKLLECFTSWLQQQYFDRPRDPRRFRRG